MSFFKKSRERVKLGKRNMVIWSIFSSPISNPQIKVFEELAALGVLRRHEQVTGTVEQQPRGSTEKKNPGILRMKEDKLSTSRQRLIALKHPMGKCKREKNGANMLLWGSMNNNSSLNTKMNASCETQKETE